MARDVQIFETPAALFEGAAELVARTARAAVAARGRFMIALSGGSTPRGLYGVLSSAPTASAVPWASVHVFFGDERHAGPGDPDSNYKMAKDTLLSRVPIPSHQIHRFKAEQPDLRVTALQYEHDLLEAFQIAPGAVPRFDCILLGLGADGHTASLFPGTDALDVRDRLVTANHVPQLQTDRVTLTFPVLDAAAQVLFLVEGAAKSAILRDVLASAPSLPEPEPGPERGPEPKNDAALLPSARVQPVNGDVIWMVDRAALPVDVTRPPHVR